MTPHLLTLHPPSILSLLHIPGRLQRPPDPVTSFTVLPGAAAVAGGGEITQTRPQTSQNAPRLGTASRPSAGSETRPLHKAGEQKAEACTLPKPPSITMYQQATAQRR